MDGLADGVRVPRVSRPGREADHAHPDARRRLSTNDDIKPCVPHETIERGLLGGRLSNELHAFLLCNFVCADRYAATMPAVPLPLTRAQILGHRRRAGLLDARRARGPDSLRRAAWAGLQDSMPRAAVLSIHARMKDTAPDAWADPALVQLWGPRFSVFAVAAEDRAVFTLGRLPEDEKGLRRAVDTADQLEEFLAGRELPFGQAGHNALRYGAATGRLLLRWNGARQATIRVVPAPDMDPPAARAELVRRYLHIYGPSTPASFADWAAVSSRSARASLESISGELIEVRSPIGGGWILASDEASFTRDPDPPAPARLLPSGDSYWMYQGADRQLIVPAADRRRQLWTPRVWPGALLVDGEIAGTWRRTDADIRIEACRSFSPGEREAIETEATSLPLPLTGDLRVHWDAP
jgi:hypothetical protein